MSNDSSKTSPKEVGQRARYASDSRAPVPPSDDSSLSQAEKQVADGLSPLPSALSPVQKLWGPWAGIVYAVIAFFSAQFLAAFALYGIADMRGLKGGAVTDWLNTVPIQFAFILCAEVLTFGAIWWFLRHRKFSLRTIGFTRPRWQYIGWALGGFAVYFAVYVVLYSFVVKYLPGIDVNQEQDIGFKDVSGALPLVLTFVSLVVLPPIVEETVFRGFIFTGLRGRYRFIIAALVTSVLFAAAHLEFGNGKPLLWIAAIDTFTLSMVMCFVREKTGSIVPTIFIHAIKNCVAFLVLYVFVS